MNEALYQDPIQGLFETLYALRIIYWCRGDRPMLRQIERDIQALKSEQN